jgi:predicted hotdog family 3-hydroxylacyl-ACP dehydratase
LTALNREQIEALIPHRDPFLWIDAVDEIDQKRIVASLASECHLPIGEMATLYERERAELALGAHITKYVHIFATRNVLDVLRQRDLDKQNPTPGKPALIGA